MKILFLQMKRYSEFARLCFRSERVFVMGGDPTKNCNFQRGKVGLLWSKKFWGGDPTKNCNFQKGKVGLLWSKRFLVHFGLANFHGSLFKNLIFWDGSINVISVASGSWSSAQGGWPRHITLF